VALTFPTMGGKMAALDRTMFLADAERLARYLADSGELATVEDALDLWRDAMQGHSLVHRLLATWQRLGCPLSQDQLPQAAQSLPWLRDLEHLAVRDGDQLVHGRLEDATDQATVLRITWPATPTVTAILDGAGAAALVNDDDPTTARVYTAQPDIAERLRVAGATPINS
jgi:hypothetical protein